MADNAKTVRGKYQRLARFYDFLDVPFEKRRYSALRRQLLSGATGRLLDAGVGTGRNIAYYPPAVQPTGIDLSAAMLARAAQRSASLGTPVELLEMDALHTTFPDGHFDCIVSSFMFCVLDDTHQLPALKELGRICRPGGQIRILEYAISEVPLKRAVMRLWAPWVRWAYGATFDRNTEQYLPAAGLTLLEKRFVFGDIIKLIVATPGE
ncbi:MAG: class I SAM-dependent methyltransferase [bacterium]